MTQLSSKFLCKGNDFFTLTKLLGIQMFGTLQFATRMNLSIFSSTEVKSKTRLLRQFLDVLALTYLVLSYMSIQ